MIGVAAAVGVGLAIIQPFGSSETDGAEKKSEPYSLAEGSEAQHELSSARLSGDRIGAAGSPAIVGSLALDIEGIASWINSDPIALLETRGKVVLIDFWTYTCVNCIRTFPFLKVWHSRYSDDGLVIVGVHSPEFAFEKDLNNVSNTVEENGITWPVALDNDHVTWDNFSNRVWPAKYLIDQEGALRYRHLGKGNYSETEEQIRRLLMEAGSSLDVGNFVTPSDQPFDPEFLDSLNAEITRELYTGYARDFHDTQAGGPGYVRQPEYYQDQEAVIFFEEPKEMLAHALYFSGFWFLGSDSVRAWPGDYRT